MKKQKKINLSPSVKFDSDSNQFEIKLKETGYQAFGKTKKEAVNMLYNQIKDDSVEFFYNLDLYSKVPSLKKKHSFFYKFGTCKTEQEFENLLDLEQND